MTPSNIISAGVGLILLGWVVAAFIHDARTNRDR